MFHILLFTPQIPPNTGNIIRLCANTGAWLHLIRPLGFTLDEKSCRRAGLDYHDMARVQQHDTLDDCLRSLDNPRVFAVTKFASTRYDQVNFAAGDALLFGAETTGLPADIHARFDEGHRIGLPMTGGNRSLNLSNAVSIVSYEAWRQCGFANSATPQAGQEFS